EPDIAHHQIAPVVAQTSQSELARGALYLGHLANIAQPSFDRDVGVCVKIQLAWSANGAGAIRPRAFQPGLFPDQLAGCLATSMAPAVTAQGLEQHGVADSSHSGAVGILPNLFDAPMNRNAVPTESCHLWHE